MKTAANNSSFTAHGGMRDIPRGAVPLQKSRPPKAKVSGSRRSTYLLALLALALMLLLIRYSPQIDAYVNRPVKTVLMENSLQRVDEQDVRAVLAAHLEVGFFEVDVRAVKAQLEAHPWIEQATIRRVWPDSLSVVIAEEVAIARWGESALLNQYGEIFEPKAIADDLALPILKGPDGAQRKVMEQYQAFSQMLFSSGLRVRELELNERGSWTFRMYNDVFVTIGRNDVVERMQRFIKLYDRYLFNQIDDIELLDLRYNNGVAVRKKTGMPDKVESK